MDPRLVAIGLARPVEPPIPAPSTAAPVAARAATRVVGPVRQAVQPSGLDDLDPRLIAIGLARPVEQTVVAPPTPAPVVAPAAPVFAPVRQAVQPSGLEDVDPRLIAIGLAHPVEPAVAAPPAAKVATPPAAAVAAPTAAPVFAPLRQAVPVAPLAAPTAAPVFAPLRQAAPVAPPNALLRQAVRLRDGRRELAGVCELDSSGIRLSGGRPVQIPWPDVRTISVELGLVSVAAANSSVSMAVALDGVCEPDLAPLFRDVLEEGRAGTLEPRMGALHELTLGIDRTIESFADADDPVVPLAVGAFAAFAAIVLIAALPMIVVLLAHIQSVPLGTFAILPRVASYDPRVIVGAFAAAVALAAAVSRFALGSSAEVWARGTMRGWHRDAEGFEAAARRMIARLMLTPRIAAIVAAIALATLVPSVFARTTLDGTGIHTGFGLPFISQDRSWAGLTDVSSIAVGFGERAEGFDTQLVFSDGSTLSTRGQDLVGGSERAFYDFAHIQVR
jgi:hypothetical protein